MWFDQMAIPSDAKNVEGAHKFIDFIMRPEVIAKASNYVVYANGNKASQPLLDKEVLEDPAVYPDEATAKKLFVHMPYPPKTQRHRDARLDRNIKVRSISAKLLQAISRDAKQVSRLLLRLHGSLR